MRILTRTGLFLLSLVLGLQAVTLVDRLVSQFALPPDLDVLGPEEHERAELPKGVRITYDGMYSLDEDFPRYLRFIIYNGSLEDLTCTGYDGRCAYPQVYFNGGDATAWVCQNGSFDYRIRPAESAELLVSVENFARLPDKTENVVIGYRFEHPDGRSDQYLAEPIVLPAEFRKAVSKYLKKVRDLEAGIY